MAAGVNAISVTGNDNAGQCLLCALAGMLFAAVVMAVAAKLLFLAPRAPLALTPDTVCDLSRDAVCELALPDGGSVHLSLGSRPAPLLRPFALEVRVKGSSAQAEEVDFSGVNMPMAFVRAYLSPGEQPGTWRAQTTLPLCASGRMSWQASVRLEQGKRQVIAPFRFETQG